MPAPVDLLARPVYGMAQVDRVLGLRHGTAERWIDGYERSGRWYDPVVRTQHTGNDIVTWGEFSEARLLAEYRSAGVPMLRMRPVVERLREEFGYQYPLAHATWLTPHGRELVERVQTDVGLDERLLLVVYRSGQLVLSIPAQEFERSVDFANGVVARFRPDPKLPEVVVDPLRQFGDPVVRSVPTAVIAEQHRAGDSIPFIADGYMLSEEQVRQAIAYEAKGAPTPLAA
jgi:uncharacterized protein (DUF433 family)